MPRSASRLADELDRLRLQIHQAALEPELWHDVLGTVVELLNARCANVMLTKPGSLAPALYVFKNVDPEAQRLFETHWHKHDLWLHAGAAYPARSIMVGPQLVPEPTLFGSEFYNDYLRHQEVGRVLANLFERNGAMFAHLSAFRAARDEEFAESDCKLMRALTPHLATAVAIHVRLSGLEDRLRATEAALDRLPVVVCLIDRTSRITYRNLMAGEILAANDGVGERSGNLHAAAARDHRELTAQVGAAVATGLGKAASSGAVLSISRRSLKRPYSVLIAPVICARDPTRGIVGETRPCAIVLIVDLERQPHFPCELLAERYQLTPAEARLACEILAGSSLQDAADRFGVACGTARNQLKQIFAKTEVTRQAELVRLLTADLAAHAAQLVR
jgi:DNA-binding CsgD family transcriptional regulator/PAS domain-containing protein